MRKITRLAIDAFMSNTPFKLSGTEVVVDEDFTELRVHGNGIAIRFHRTGNIYITTLGFINNLTKERLNGIPGVNISQKNFQWFLNGVPWDGLLVKV